MIRETTIGYVNLDVYVGLKKYEFEMIRGSHGVWQVRVFSEGEQICDRLQFSKGLTVDEVVKQSVSKIE